MFLMRLLPLAALLLAGCAPPPSVAEADAFTPGPDCQQECAAGYRWAEERELDDAVKCRGESEFARGCRAAVAFRHPFGS